MSIHIYANLPQRSARIHRADCHFFQDRGLLTSPDNAWLGPYETREVAEDAVGRLLAFVTTVHQCTRCSPYGPR